jgi:hypothetical protein
LLNLPATALRENPRQNIRGGAALLAAAGRQLSGGALPNSTGGWYAAVAESSGSSELLSAQGFADDVYARLRAGASRSTDDGRIVQLRGEPAVHPDRTLIAALHLAKPRPSSVECPANVDCSFLPAAYAQNSVDKGDYGNYDQAKRPTDLKINYIVIHDTEGSFQGTLDTFTDPTSLVATHYVVRSSDGHVTQMVPTKNVPFHAGNWYFNMHSIGIEHEGIAESGGTWYTEAMYRSSARLVRYLAHRFQIPLDRQHILGHDNVPGIDPAHIADMHWDPAVYWDWSHYLSLLGAPIRGHGGEHSAMVTINPNFQTNQPAVSGCDGVKNLPVQGSSAVYLHTGPSGTAPLLSDHALHLDGAQGTTRICDWGDRASTGQQFMVAGRDGDWTAIWYGGQKAWFENPARHPTAVSARGLAVRARPGRTSVPVYGRAYPEAAAYPGSIPVQPVTPLGYSVAAGQSYVLGEPTGSDYYYAKTVDSSLPDDHTVVSGTDRYYEIQLGYRVAYVRSADVMVVPAR